MAGSRKQAAAKGKRSQTSITASTTHRECLQQALQWFVGSLSLTNVKLHGNVNWNPAQLVGLAVLWVWSDKSTLTGAFKHAHQLAKSIFGKAAVSTYQGLTNALQAYGQQLLPQLWLQLHRLMERSAGKHWRIGQWLPLAVDGSRITTPRTQSNEAAFAATNYGSGRKARSRTKWKNKRRRNKPLGAPVKPQVWLTLIWHMGLKMPWCWKTGRSTSSERRHLQETLQDHDFPEKTLFCGDAGFVGYEFWKSILDAGHSFVIRVGGNVRLLLELGAARHDNGLVFLWPSEVMRQQQPPLVLRLLEFQGARGKVYLVTNVLSERQFTLKQARELYRLRWGVELQFRAYKQTFRRTELRSRAASNAISELDWSLAGLWLIQLYAVREQIKIGSPPEQSSVALALDVIQEAMRNWNSSIQTKDSIRHQLRRAVKDNYRRRASKQARYRPDSKDKPSATRPIIVKATRAQKQAYQTLRTAA